MATNHNRAALVAGTDNSGMDINYSFSRKGVIKRRFSAKAKSWGVNKDGTPIELSYTTEIDFNSMSEEALIELASRPLVILQQGRIRAQDLDFAQNLAKSTISVKAEDCTAGCSSGRPSVSRMIEAASIDDVDSMMAMLQARKDALAKEKAEQSKAQPK